MSWPNSHHWPLSIMASNNPHALDWLNDSLSSPPVAGMWWAHWCRCPVASVASSKWMQHTGGGWGETPHMIVKRFGWKAIQIKRYMNVSFSHSFIQMLHSLLHLFYSIELVYLKHLNKHVNKRIVWFILTNHFIPKALLSASIALF